MKTLHFSIQIKAPAEKVWKTLWDDATYSRWTAAFCEGSYVVTDWNEGSRILFLSPGGEGMFSTIDKKIPNKFMAFKHLGVVKEGKEQPADEESEKWTGAMETYTLEEKNGVTDVIVSVATTDGFEQHFNDMFPKALENLKTLSEN